MCMHAGIYINKIYTQPFTSRPCLNENGPYTLIYLTTWSPTNENLWKVLGVVVLLEEACHWACGLRGFESRCYSQLAFSVPPACGTCCKLSAIDSTLPTCCHVSYGDGSWTHL